MFKQTQYKIDYNIIDHGKLLLAIAYLIFMIFHICMRLVSIILKRGYAIEIGNVQLNCVLSEL